MLKRIVLVLKGFVIGIANVIPGVSGGTLALILGIYERFIKALSNFSFYSLKTIIFLFSFKRKNYQEFRKEMKRVDALFLALILIGIGSGLAAFSRIVTYLIENYHDITYGFFFGLILASVIVPLSMVKKFNFKAVLGILVGIGIVVALALIESDKAKIANAEMELLAKQATDSLYSQLDVSRIIMVFIAGMLATTAMVLPGISGSFISILLGQYFFLMEAIKTGTIVVLLIYVLGAIVGIKLFSKLMKLLFEKFHNTIMAFLTGLVIGSLFVTWPFKGSAVIGDETIYLSNIWPKQLGTNEILTIVTALAGIALVIVMLFVSKKANKPAALSAEAETETE